MVEGVVFAPWYKNVIFILWPSICGLCAFLRLNLQNISIYSQFSAQNSESQLKTQFKFKLKVPLDNFPKGWFLSLK